MAVAANRFLEILDLGTNGIHEGRAPHTKISKYQNPPPQMDLGFMSGARSSLKGSESRNTHPQILSDGCRFISDALTTNSSLTQLKLWGNEIREGVRRLENALIIKSSTRTRVKGRKTYFSRTPKRSEE